MVISEMLEAEFEEVLAFWLNCGLLAAVETIHRTELSEALHARQSAVLIARHEARICATVMVEADGVLGWIFYLGVDPAHRKRGIGRTMMDCAERWLARHGVRELQLQVKDDNAGARDFYSALGFARHPIVTLGKRIEVVP